ncbi:hypothetical protein QWY22_12225 [Planococcus liqunii]|uniref:hypothetical protein n=1 Tax=Planococcus liqunii TaxID=3058394 RepID=UPI00261187CF|nr:hypothetical protein [Planococcus sp. N056]WKA49667.1 hypothetical protein QWY22_12225 [Planococcus sp. N056]
MGDDILKWLYGTEKSGLLNKYTTIASEEINEDVKNKVMELESLAETLAEQFQIRYADKFEAQKKRNLSVWVSRDLDGDEISSLTADCCLEKEYRSQLAVNYHDPAEDNDFYEATIPLWHYKRGFFRNSAVLYDESKNELKKDIEHTLERLLSQKFR